MNSPIDLMERPTFAPNARRIFPPARNRAKAIAIDAPNYSQVDIDGPDIGPAAAEFDRGTLAVVACIIAFKLFLLSFLFVSL